MESIQEVRKKASRKSGEAIIVKILYLFPDTNLFIQCLALQELDWSCWSDFDEVRLIVCRPVQREIDNQKNRGSDRVGKRARKIHSLFGKVIASESCYELIHESQPRVRLLVEPNWLPSSELQDRLDYNQIDDQIVGCIHTYRNQNPGCDVQLLTHDSGPMATAKMLSLPFVPIPEEWLLKPEKNETERENSRLRKELEQLKKAEPQFAISFQKRGKNQFEPFEFEFSTYEPLSEIEISSMVDSLKKQFPLVTNFNLPTSREHKLLMSLGIKEVFTPPSDEEIKEYTENKYPLWVNKCRRILKCLPISLENPIIFSFPVVNQGTRPAKNVLVTIKAEGNFQIRPLQDHEHGGESGDADEILLLPLPPKTPEGKWTIKNFLTESLSNLDMFNEIFPKPPDLSRIYPHSSFSSSLPDYSDILPRTHNPNKFYYNSTRSAIPTKSFSLECDQWRHEVDEEIFKCKLCFDKESEEIKGILECSIHAENLSIPFKKTISVVGKAVSSVSVRDCAENMIKNLFDRAEKRVR